MQFFPLVSSESASDKIWTTNVVVVVVDWDSLSKERILALQDPRLVYANTWIYD